MKKAILLSFLLLFALSCSEHYSKKKEPPKAPESVTREAKPLEKQELEAEADKGGGDEARGAEGKNE